MNFIVKIYTIYLYFYYFFLYSEYICCSDVYLFCWSAFNYCQNHFYQCFWRIIWTNGNCGCGISFETSIKMASWECLLLTSGKQFRFSKQTVILYMEPCRVSAFHWEFTVIKRATMKLIPFSSFVWNCKQSSIPLDRYQIEELIQRLDRDRTGMVDYRWAFPILTKYTHIWRFNIYVTRWSFGVLKLIILTFWLFLSLVYW